MGSHMILAQSCITIQWDTMKSNDFIYLFIEQTTSAFAQL